jgi:predicted lipoprotein with Yx(FWY)xxD motif
MPVRRCLIILLLLIVGMTAGNAAPNIPPGEMAGRERERFIPSPVDRLTDPFAWPRQAEPLYRWCDDKAPRRAKGKQSRREQGC